MKPADSDQIAKARRWLNSKHFTADSGVTLDCLAMLPDEHVIALNIRQLAQLMEAFAASERQAVIEDCAKLVEEFTDGTKMFSSRSAIARAIRSMA